MKRTLTLFAAILLLAVGATAQKLSYQAVIRNNANELVTETTVQVAVSVLDASNAVQYAETHSNVQTNRNGLLSLMIGEGTPSGNATLSDVVWAGASVRTVITLPNNSTITSVTPVNSVPYALYADNVNPDMVSDAIADYIASHNIGGEINVQADWNVTDPTSDAYIQHKPDLFSGDYNDLANKPTIPTNVSQLANDAGYITTEQCSTLDLCALADLVEQLQNQIADLQTSMDSINDLNNPDAQYGVPCPGAPTVTDYDGNVYNTVQIGEQCWMKENLRSRHYAAGTEIADWYDPNTEIQNIPKYGYFYKLASAMNGANETNTIPSEVQGVCPNGWHLPSKGEWEQLVDYVGNNPENTCVIKALASTTGWQPTYATCSAGNDKSTNNSTGFTAYPAGHLSVTITGNSSGWNTTTSFVGYGNSTDFWSCSKNSNTSYWRFGIDNTIGFNSNDGNGGYSIRCLRDMELPESYSQPCPGTPTVTDYDCNVYNTIQIGDQCWMKENLRTTHFADGVSIPLGTDRDASTPYRYIPNNEEHNVLLYGYLYNWPATMNNSSSSSANPSGVQGICPNGWHVPSDSEWTQFSTYVSSQPDYCCNGNSNYIAKAIATNTRWVTNDNACSIGNNQTINNATGFSALPAGEFYNTNDTREFHRFAFFWSSTQNSTSNAYYRSLSYSSSALGSYSSGKSIGRSVRCLKD